MLTNLLAIIGAVCIVKPLVIYVWKNRPFQNKKITSIDTIDITLGINKKEKVQ